MVEVEEGRPVVSDDGVEILLEAVVAAAAAPEEVNHSVLHLPWMMGMPPYLPLLLLLLLLHLWKEVMMVMDDGHQLLPPSPSPAAAAADVDDGWMAEAEDVGMEDFLRTRSEHEACGKREEQEVAEDESLLLFLLWTVMMTVVLSRAEVEDESLMDHLEVG